eukprot:TRINITY_DN9572_c0_g1_i2.p1 TRINITY_DN9572_c0_g1~~TRINITY_DN9572_c0_g1_i2.p1  ORF type:complete len:381 (-),score=62.13 TRINITY_DN9572_c0_g1_i2:633-1775(-)
MELCDLTDDTLGYIFRFLDDDEILILRAVSRRLKEVAQDNVLRLDFSQSNLPVQQVMDIAISFHNLHELLLPRAFNFRRMVTRTDLHRFCTQCPLLLRLDISDCYRISGDDIEAVTKLCPRLQHLSLKSTHTLSKGNMVAIGNLRHLRILNVIGCPIADFEPLALLGNCHELQTLNISNEPYSNSISLMYDFRRSPKHVASDPQADALLEALAQGCPDLRQLILCRLYESSTARWVYSDSAVEAVARGCRKLEVVSMYGVTHPNRALRALINHCPLLRVLQVPMWSPKADTVQMLCKLQWLEMLTISSGKLSHDTMHGLSLCRNLNSVEMDNVKDMSQFDVRRFVENCTKLTHLMLNQCDQERILRQCGRVSSDEMGLFD